MFVALMITLTLHVIVPHMMLYFSYLRCLILGIKAMLTVLIVL